MRVFQGCGQLFGLLVQEFIESSGIVFKLLKLGLLLFSCLRHKLVKSLFIFEQSRNLLLLLFDLLVDCFLQLATFQLSFELLDLLFVLIASRFNLLQLFAAQSVHISEVNGS